VIIPQFLGRPTFLEQVTDLAAETGAEFHEIVLLDSGDNAVRRSAARPTSGYVEPTELATMYDNLLATIADRPHVKTVSTVQGEVDQAYQDLLACLRA
jgi:hypothetical protein